MKPIAALVRQHSAKLFKLAANILCVIALVMVAGCGLVIFRESRPNPEASRERAIGRLAASTTQATWDNVDHIRDVLVIDVGTQNSLLALLEARKSLEGRGWVVLTSHIPELVQMESTKWENVRLVIRPLVGVHGTDYYLDSKKSDIRRAIEDARARPGAYVTIEISREGG
ncbi:hypothetical protein ACFXJ8_43945 [Nonomuraea sp. NPDC059194]|uniref:hypothetical protein n=1 Tax=Nonomuraea sp. NPDC059194 TaxID=3346764 RepID=UPI0036D11AA6